MRIANRFNRPPVELKKGGGERFTESAGYMPADVLVRRMIQAGVDYDQYRRDHYDYAPGEEVPDDSLDPTRSPGYDMADAHQQLRELEASIQHAQEQAILDASKEKAAIAAKAEANNVAAGIPGDVE